MEPTSEKVSPFQLGSLHEISLSFCLCTSESHLQDRQWAGWLCLRARMGVQTLHGWQEARWNSLILGGLRSALAVRERRPAPCFLSLFALVQALYRPSIKINYSSAAPVLSKASWAATNRSLSKSHQALLQTTPLTALGSQPSRELARWMFLPSCWREVLPAPTKPLQASPWRSGARPQ